MDPRRSRYFTYIKPITRSKFAKTYSSLIFSLITILVFSYYALRPTITTIFSLQKSTEEQTAVLNSLKEKVTNLVEGKRNYENISLSTKDKIQGLVPDNPALSSIINSLTFAAQSSEASVSGIQFQPTVLENPSTKLSKAAQVSEIEFTFNAQGSFVHLMELLTILKRSDRLITITGVSFNQPTEGDLIMSITGKVYYLKG